MATGMKGGDSTLVEAALLLVEHAQLSMEAAPLLCMTSNGHNSIHLTPNELWTAPVDGYFKRNFDVAFNSVKKTCGEGMILRNHLGHPIKVALVFLENVSCLPLAEGLVLRESLLFVKNWGYKDVIVEGDCQPVINFHASIEALIVIFNDIKSLHKVCEGSSLAWVSRQGNVVTHILSNKTLLAECSDLSGAFGSSGC
ncbi:uncharacterized protein LOC132277565 [Cornus florida]|uniref:uncharacterized protein LOC132277565 n=1 Tax=Cornus florida TaxID=4283 RepID=UPI00289DE5BB|nr:uncharacterized protein LOC132277565 [Cornus florida]